MEKLDERSDDKSEDLMDEIVRGNLDVSPHIQKQKSKD